MRSLAAPLIAGLLAAGCAMPHTELGKPPPVAALRTLQPGVSTRAQVLQSLGEPQGQGAARMPGLPLQDVLLYESDTLEGKKAHMKMLIVYLTRSTGVYEGYMWFTSGVLLGPAK